MSIVTQEKIIEAVDDLKEEAVKLLCALVSYDSTLGNESRIQDFMHETLSELGGNEGFRLKVKRIPIELDKIKELKGFSPVDWSCEGKDNVVGTYTPKISKGKSLIINGHMDVVPTGPPNLWSEETQPFMPVVNKGDGRIYGRGCGDMKAGIVAAIIALKALLKNGVAPAAELIFEMVLEEECTGNGTLACRASGITADGALIPEPFPAIVTAQLGVMWLRVTVIGRPAHVLDTSAGVNAIEAAFKMFQKVRELEDDWNVLSVLPVEFHNMKHPVNINLGVIKGGEWPSSVPTQCDIDVRIGIPPGITLEVVRERVEGILQAKADELGVRHSVLYRGFQAEGCVMDKNWDMMKLLGSSHQKVHGSPAVFAPITCTTDARFFNLYNNIPATCYGPASSDIHGLNESVSIESMQNVAKVLALFISEWCGLELLSK